MSRLSLPATQVFVACAIHLAFAAGDLDCFPSSQEITDDAVLLQLNHRRRRKHALAKESPPMQEAKKPDGVTSVPVGTTPASNATTPAQAAAVSASYSVPPVATPAAAAAFNPALNATQAPAVAASSSSPVVAATAAVSSPAFSSLPLAAAPVAAATSSPVSNAVVNPAAAESSSSLLSMSEVSTAKHLLLHLKHRLGISGINQPPDLKGSLQEFGKQIADKVNTTLNGPGTSNANEGQNPAEVQTPTESNEPSTKEEYVVDAESGVKKLKKQRKPLGGMIPLPKLKDWQWHQILEALTLVDVFEGILAPVLCLIAGGLTLVSGLTWFLQFAGDSAAGLIQDNTAVQVQPWHYWPSWMVDSSVSTM
eukprot:gnl/TRDRNA2_/TRDRNA2_187272_c0_seq1.p1 gnl/TRDRNA2_/TRDRNA2_187272_c0~~gnl/TRDRNA2_/TRDRNA2_187272_c0_seq1.p1  ORF type:complete len:366 (+),score=48.28 gnl/TRDRNA2_/TRDRNA2_187272_c0_seq1:86-1183(+)